MYRRNGNTVSFHAYVDRLDRDSKEREKWYKKASKEREKRFEKASKEREEWFMRWLEKFDQDRIQTAQRLELERKASEERLAADRKATEERLAIDREKHSAEIKEFITEFRHQRRWLITTFAAVLAVLVTLLFPYLGIGEARQQPSINIQTEGN